MSPALRRTGRSDGLLYQFDLRHGVTFQDGTPLDAAAFVQTFQRALAPTTKSPLAGSLLGSLASIKTTGSYSFAIRLEHPYAFFLYNLTDGGRLMALSPTALRKEGNAFGRHPVSTGPWMVQSGTTGSVITLVKNPRYTWGPSFVRHGPPAINTLVFRLITDEDTQTDALRSLQIG
jgi:peptide/nickel transport system substrate-binding protein